MKYLTIDAKFVGTILELNECGIVSIDEIIGLEDNTNLEKIYLNNNYLKSLKSFPKLNSLSELDISSNELTSIIGIENLISLEILNLNNNQISEITPIKDFTKLKELDISENNVEDLKCLENLKV